MFHENKKLVAFRIYIVSHKRAYASKLATHVYAYLCAWLNWYNPILWYTPENATE